LDKPFDTAREDDPWKCPRYVAKDKEAIYFPEQDDCGSYPAKIWLDISRYLDVKVPISYPG